MKYYCHIGFVDTQNKFEIIYCNLNYVGKCFWFLQQRKHLRTNITDMFLKVEKQNFFHTVNTSLTLCFYNIKLWKCRFQRLDSRIKYLATLSTLSHQFNLQSFGSLIHLFVWEHLLQQILYNSNVQVDKKIIQILLNLVNGIGLISLHRLKNRAFLIKKYLNCLLISDFKTCFLKKKSEVKVCFLLQSSYLSMLQFIFF